jgi:DNA-binding LacI/PurR family transcriptional regulator
LDLAKATGFSIGSISRAFNNSPNIKSESKERILEAARQLGYRPHSGARTIKLGRTGRWGLLLPSFENPYYAKLLDAFDLEARRRGASVQLGLSHHQYETAHRIVKYWGNEETDGIIADIRGIDQATAALMRERRIPTVFLHGRPSPHFDVLEINRTEATQRALKTLAELGHRQVAYVGIPNPSALVDTSFLVWKEWMQSRGETNFESLVFFVKNGREGGKEAWAALQQLPQRPTAVFCCNDIMACGLALAASKDGIRLPQDLSLIGADDIEQGQRLGLSTMRMDYSALAAMGLDLLESQRLGMEGRLSRVGLVDTEFVLRDSVGPSSR